MDDMRPPCAIIFLNANCAYFDEHCQQMLDLQSQGLKGLNNFNKRYPHAPVMVQGGTIPFEMVQFWIDQLKEEDNKIIPSPIG